METKGIVRYGWLKAMYIWTILGAGGFGIGLLFLPDMMRTMFGYPSQEPLLFGISGSIYVAFGLVAILGFLSPVKFAPVLLLQLCYKLIWFIAVLLPAFIRGSVPGYGWIFAGIFATYVIGDLIAIPFPIVFAREPV
jgi:hypothetical protein